MGIALSRQLSDLKEHLSELQLDVRQQIQDIKSDMQINCECERFVLFFFSRK